MGFETGLSFILYPWTHYTIIMVLLVKNEKVFMVYIAIFIGMLASSIFFVDSRTVVSFKRNLDQVMKEWNCKDPQSKLVYLEDEWDQYNPSAIYLPHAAVVKRCGKSVGCCKNGQLCSPSEEEEITFVFEEIYRGKKSRKEITLSNHIRCECRNSEVDPIK